MKVPDVKISSGSGVELAGRRSLETFKHFRYILNYDVPSLQKTERSFVFQSFVVNVFHIWQQN